MQVGVDELGIAISLFSAVFVFCGWVAKTTILNPLNESIMALQSTIRDFKEAIDGLEKNQHRVDRKLAVMEEKIEVLNDKVKCLVKRGGE